MKKAKILVLPGDGIGPEVMNEAIRVLTRVAQIEGVRFDFQEADAGGISIDKTGSPLDPKVLTMAKKSDAVLLGAVGGPKWDNLPADRRPEQGLLALRKGLKLFANLRPAKIFHSLAGASTLKKEVVDGIDILVVRELTGGIYFGRPRGIKRGETGSKGINTLVYTTEEICRIAKTAFEMAKIRRKKVTSVDKANILETSILWREEVSKIASEYPDVKLEHMYVDNCAMQLVRNPGQFDVIVTENMFGDILSDEASMLTGSIGMLPSASVGDKKNRLGFPQGMYEPVHGSAPDIAGKGLANPLATILSCAMMLRYSLGMNESADRVEKAVNSALEEGYRSADIFAEGCKKVSTTEMGDLICDRIAK